MPTTVTKSAQPAAQPASERRAAEAEVRRLVAKFAAKHAGIAGTTRRWLRKRLPTAHEVVYAYRDNFVISFSPSDRGYEGVFAMRGSAEGVRLYFTDGKSLKDPDGLLQGTARARYIDVDGAATLRRPAVLELVAAALSRNRIPFPRTGRGSVTIK